MLNGTSHGNEKGGSVTYIGVTSLHIIHLDTFLGQHGEKKAYVRFASTTSADASSLDVLYLQSLGQWSRR